jgi:hypothetical protein
LRLKAKFETAFSLDSFKGGNHALSSYMGQLDQLVQPHHEGEISTQNTARTALLVNI